MSNAVRGQSVEPRQRGPGQPWNLNTVACKGQGSIQQGLTAPKGPQGIGIDKGARGKIRGSPWISELVLGKPRGRFNQS
jgi:hypothetical protein